jgi:hypothetical protein
MTKGTNAFVHSSYLQQKEHKVLKQPLKEVKLEDCSHNTKQFNKKIKIAKRQEESLFEKN